MTRVKLPYYVVRKGRGYFEIGKERAKATSLPASEPLGPDGPEAWAKADRAYRAMQDALKGKNDNRLGGYPSGSLGAAYVLWKASPDWKEKKDRTQEDYTRAWVHIEPEFGNTLISKITVADSERFHRKIRENESKSEAYRTLKVWRALLNMLEKKHLLPKAPIGTVSNPQPVGRGQFWVASEIARMVRAARKMKRPALGLIIRMAWETAMSPVDCRTFKMSMLKQDVGGWYIDRPRTKTGAAAKPPISKELAEDLIAYEAGLKAGGLELLPSAALFRNRLGNEWDKNFLVNQFQDVRRVTFGKAEKRQAMDIRRSANLEAELGGASAEDRAMVLANALDRNKALDATYTPSTVARARKVLEARKAGRELLAQEVRQRPNLEQSRKTSGGEV